MTTTDHLDGPVLHTLRLKGRSAPPGISAATGADGIAVLAVLERQAEQGLVILRTGRISGWALTPDGRSRAEEVLAAERSGADLAGAAALYDGEFLAANARFKQLIATRQLDGGPLAAVVPELTALHEANLDLLQRLSVSLPRLAGYRDRFDAAYQRVLAGDEQALARPMTDSYHDVWMELHEDLLLLLEREREEND